MALQTRGGLVESWDRFDPYHLYGVKPASMLPAPPVQGLDDGLARSAGPALLDRDGDSKPWHPDSPLFWFGMLAAVTLGFVAVSTSVRVGPFKAAAAVGK